MIFTEKQKYNPRENDFPLLLPFFSLIPLWMWVCVKQSNQNITFNNIVFILTHNLENAFGCCCVEAWRLCRHFAWNVSIEIKIYTAKSNMARIWNWQLFDESKYFFIIVVSVCWKKEENAINNFIYISYFSCGETFFWKGFWLFIAVFIKIYFKTFMRIDYKFKCRLNTPSISYE